MKGLEFFESLDLSSMIKCNTTLNKIKDTDIVSKVVGLDSKKGVFIAEQIYDNKNFYLKISYENIEDGNLINEKDIYLIRGREELEKIAISFAEVMVYSDELRLFLNGEE